MHDFNAIDPDIVLARALDGVAKRQPPKIESETVLISAKDAMTLAVKTLRTAPRALAVLDGHLLDGRLNAYSQTVVTEPDFGAIRPTPTDAQPVSQDNSGKRWDYLMWSCWQDNVALLDGSPLRDWATGIFVRVDSRPIRARTFPGSDEVFIQARNRMVAYDVHFLRSQIDIAIEANIPAGAKRRVAAAVKRRATGALTKAQWAKILAPLQALADKGELISRVPGLYHWGGQAELKRLIEELGEAEHDSDLLTPSTLRERAIELMACDAQARGSGNQHKQS